MSDLVFVLTLASALGCGLMAGFFFAFSTCVMGALGRLPTAEGVAAMQRINIVVINPVFLSAFMGTGAICIAAALAAVTDSGESYVAYVVAGGAVYVLGAIVVTMAFNVPRNNALARLDAGDEAASDHWAVYLREWTRWNHVRTVAPLVAAGLEAVSLYVG